jgi:hypothetical protein
VLWIRKNSEQTSRKKHDKEKLKSETYILERTQALFTRRSDKPFSGAVRFEPVVLGAAPLRPAASTAATLPPRTQGPIPRPSQQLELDHGPRRHRGTHEHPRLHRLG